MNEIDDMLTGSAEDYLCTCLDGAVTDGRRWFYAPGHRAQQIRTREACTVHGKTNPVPLTEAGRRLVAEHRDPCAVYSDDPGAEDWEQWATREVLSIETEMLAIAVAGIAGHGPIRLTATESTDTAGKV